MVARRGGHHRGVEEDLSAALSEWIGRPLEADGKLYGGEEADVWAASSAGQRFVIHISAPWRPSSEVAWAHAVSTQAATAVPEAIAPISVRGETSFSWHGRHVAVFPYIEGERLDREDPEQVADAARLLARIHAALLDWQPYLDPVMLGPSVVDDLLAEPELDAWWSRRLPEVRLSVCHGDYYRRNVLVADRRIRGVIDWNECTLVLLSVKWRSLHGSSGMTRAWASSANASDSSWTPTVPKRRTFPIGNTLWSKVLRASGFVTTSGTPFAAERRLRTITSVGKREHSGS